MEVTGLSVEIRTPTGSARVVRDVGFSVRAGQTLALLGESGCGKSMTAQAIVGLLDPVADVVGGRVLLEGRDVLAMSPAERRRIAGPGIGVVFQDALTALNPVYTVGSQLAEQADQVAVMYAGSVIERGPVAEVFGNPLHPLDPPSGCRFRTRCWKAEDICAEAVPADAPAPGHEQHLAACHLPLAPVGWFART